jgi:hypothetical protein
MREAAKHIVICRVSGVTLVDSDDAPCATLPA